MSTIAIQVLSNLPWPGYTKSRLCSVLSPEEAALLHRACLLDLYQALLGSDFDDPGGTSGRSRCRYLCGAGRTVAEGPSPAFLRHASMQARENSRAKVCVR